MARALDRRGQKTGASQVTINATRMVREGNDSDEIGKLIAAGTADQQVSMMAHGGEERRHRRHGHRDHLGGGFAEKGRVREDRDLGEIPSEAKALRFLLNTFPEEQQKATGLAMRNAGAPIMVIVVPDEAANEKGINSVDGGTPRSCERCSVTGSINAVVVR